MYKKIYIQRTRVIISRCEYGIDARSSSERRINKLKQMPRERGRKGKPETFARNVYERKISARCNALFCSRLGRLRLRVGWDKNRKEHLSRFRVCMCVCGMCCRKWSSDEGIAVRFALESKIDRANDSCDIVIIPLLLLLYCQTTISFRSDRWTRVRDFSFTGWFRASSGKSSTRSRIRIWFSYFHLRTETEHWKKKLICLSLSLVWMNRAKCHIGICDARRFIEVYRKHDRAKDLGGAIVVALSLSWIRVEL